MQVSEAMSIQVVTAKPTDTVQDVARIMSEIDSGAVPIVDGGVVVGLITDRDIVVRVVAEGGDISSAVKEFMTEGVESCLEDDDITDAANLMAEMQMRRLVVYNNDGALTGILSLGDIALEHRGDLASFALEEISEDDD
ncbi:CBS domain-containing protein [Rhizobium sp. CFBP 8762]|uniref:CBS domain-containing protein n=1 Tax=Rhizobium sp. CFBP 8762 TaxID=2775279 RepID=UPI00177F32EC|nr:CBS domain-containing protein [Rhizobium sp. CFBP 8762]